MNAGQWGLGTAGIVVMLLAMVDLFMTALHPDLDGPLARSVQRGVWRLLVAGDRRRRQRRRLMALAGPLMMALTFVAWVTTLVLGLALAVWPFLTEAFRSEPALGTLGFLDALYYSATSVSTLGFGDITPVSRPLQLLTGIAALCGFSMLTGIVAYLIEVLAGLHSRMRLAMRVGEDTDGRYDGVDVLASWLADEEVGDVRQRLGKWADLLRATQDDVHRFPLVSVCYRSRNPHQDPEPAVRAVAQTVLAGHILAEHQHYRRLRPALQGLDRAVTRFMVVTARQYLGRALNGDLAHPHPTDDDRAHLEDVRRRLGDHFDLAIQPEPQVDARALDLACRSRLFLDSFHRLTGWQSSDEVRWDEPVSVPGGH